MGDAKTPQASYWDNGTFGRCSINPPPQYYWENGPSDADKEKQRKWANSLGMWFGGPVFSGFPAAVRLLGGNEDQVEAAAEINVNLAMTRLGGRAPEVLPGTRVARMGYLRRPYIRKWVRDEVDKRAPRTADGRPIDPNTQQPIDGKPDLGHTPGHEFWREAQQAEAEGLTQEQFNDRMNNPDYYQLEDPSSNRSHQFEQP